MKKIIFGLTLIVFCIFIFGCTSNQNGTNPNNFTQPLGDNLVAYKNTSLGVSFNYDSNLYRDTGLSTDTYERLSKDTSEGDICEVTITKTSIPDVQQFYLLDPSSSDTKEFIALGLNTSFNLENYKSFKTAQKFYDYNVIFVESKMVTISGTNAWKSISLSQYVDGAVLEAITISLVRNNNLYEIVGRKFSSDNFDECLSAANSVISSIKFLN